MAKSVEISENMYKNLIKSDKKREKALKIANKLEDDIANMKYDCGSEVYEKLLKIIDTLNAF